MDLFSEDLDDVYFHMKNIDEILDEFYDLLEKSEDYVKKKKKGQCFKYTINKITKISDIPKSTMNDSYFFPSDIQSYIDDNSLYNLHFNCKIKKREIKVNFIIFHEIKQEDLYIINKQIQMIYMWMYIISNFSIEKCSNHLVLYVYFTPFEKKLPNNQLIILNTEHVNTGYTTGCKENTEIVLYRKEEWFKVFIHETFHNFGLDFSDMNLSLINRKLQEHFNVNVEFNLYESYCETWARIINTMFYSYFSLIDKLDPKKNYFKSQFYLNIKKEAFHSLYQLLKILNFQDLNYKLITEKKEENIQICKHLYGEKSSVFSYYIITGLLLNNFGDFLLWCKKNNNIILMFKKTPGNLEKYIELVGACKKNKFINKNIKQMEKAMRSKKVNIDDSLRMTHLNMHEIFMN
jgi:hypothetical protein